MTRPAPPHMSVATTSERKKAATTVVNTDMGCGYPREVAGNG
jgi:hypothetical protein